MKIICYSKDDILLDKLVRLYGASSVIFSADIRSIKDNDLQQSEVLIVDLKYNRIPERKNLSLPVIGLTTIPSFPEAIQLLQRGVRGYGNRQMVQSNLAQVVENVKAGQIWLPPAIISNLIATVGDGNVVEKNDNILSALSDREQEVAGFVAEGLSNQEMADKMYISLRTVKAHLSSIYNKTGLRNRLELGLGMKSSPQTV